VAACTLTAIWQFPTLPNVPEYCRATPAELSPSLAKPVSSITHARGSIRSHALRESVFRTGTTFPRLGRHKLLQALVIDTESLRRRLHRFTSTVEHQPLRVHARGRPLDTCVSATRNLFDKHIVTFTDIDQGCSIHPVIVSIIGPNLDPSQAK